MIHEYCVLLQSYDMYKAQGHSRTYPNSEDVGGDTMMSHFVRGRSNAIDWLEFRNLLILISESDTSLELGTG